MINLRLLPLVQVSSFASCNIQCEIAAPGVGQDQNRLQPVLDFAQLDNWRFSALLEGLIAASVIMICDEVILLHKSAWLVHDLKHNGENTFVDRTVCLPLAASRFSGLGGGRSMSG